MQSLKYFQTSPLTHGKTKDLTVVSKAILMKAQAEIDGTQRVLMEEHIEMGLFKTVWVEVRDPKMEAKHPGNSNKKISRYHFYT